MQLLTLAGIFILSVAVYGTEISGPCNKAREDAGIPKPGKFVPQCTKYGYFEPVQCHGSSGQCWCVIPDTGKAVEGTMIMHAMPECSMCHIKRAEALRPFGFTGNVVPQCEDNGLFKSEQHWGSTGHSWCVNVYTGEEIMETRVGPGTKRLMDCDLIAIAESRNMHNNLPLKGSCYSEILESRGCAGMPGYKTPSCTKNGYYKTEQHHGSTGYSWCVNPATGKEIEGSRRGPSEEKVECGACFKEIEDKLARRPPLGSHLAQCNQETGDYMPVQRREGYSYCVNPKTGVQEGEAKRPGDNTLLPCVNN
jgi:hypothetical protein